MLHFARWIMLFTMLTFAIAGNNKIDKDGLVESRQFGRPGGFGRPGFASLMYLIPLGVSAMMIPVMTVMIASLVGGGQQGFFGRRRRDTEDTIGNDRIKTQMLRMWTVLEKALEKFSETDDEDV